jgi:hypothetical protein
MAARKSRNQKFKRTLFSHLTDPEHINRIRYGLGTEDYLASMLKHSSTPEKMYEMVGIKASAAADAIPAPSNRKEVKSNDTDSKGGREKQK